MRAKGLQGHAPPISNFEILDFESCILLYFGAKIQEIIVHLTKSYFVTIDTQ